MNPPLLQPERRRARLVQRLQKSLQSNAWPRTQMAVLVLLTGAAGLLASFLMLQAGLEGMALRYPLAVLVAYGFFLFLLWLWLRLRNSFKDQLLDHTPGLDLPLPSNNRTPVWTSGKGGDFSGAGATGHFEAPVPTSAPASWVNTSTTVDHAGPGTGSLADGSLADDLAIPLAIAALAVGLAFSSLYIVYSAPTLMAELLLDGALSATLYRRLRKVDQQHWISTALRHTLPPFLITALLLAAAGWALQTLAVDARTLGEALQHLRTSA